MPITRTLQRHQILVGKNIWYCWKILLEEKLDMLMRMEHKGMRMEHKGMRMEHKGMRMEHKGMRMEHKVMPHTLLSSMCSTIERIDSSNGLLFLSA